MLIRNSRSCAMIFRAVSAGLPATIRRSWIAKLVKTTNGSVTRKASAATLAALCWDSSRLLIVIRVLQAAEQKCVRYFLCTRSEERRVGKECRSRWSLNHYNKRDTVDYVCV